MKNSMTTVMASDRFVKKKHWGVADRREGGGAAGTNMYRNTNTGVRIDPPPRSSNRRRLGGSKNHWKGWTPNPTGKSDPGYGWRSMWIKCVCVWVSEWVSEWVGFNVPINTLWVISETSLSSQSLALVLTT